jgi:carotenoid cleavage dioxygenase-like enzyme
LALYEGGLPYDLTPDLETVGEWDCEGRLVRNMTAHPRFDPSTGELHFFRYDLQPPFLTYYVADREANITLSCPIDLPQPVMMHDFVITEHHVVFFACPVVLDVQAITRGGQPLAWKPELGTRLGVLESGTSNGSVQWLDTDPFFVYYFMNAFEEDDSIHIDYVWRSRFFGTRADARDAREHGDALPPTLHRFTIDLPNTVRDHQLGDEIVEFPRTDERVGGKPYRFGYTLMSEQSTIEHHGAHYFSGIVQYDISGEISTVHRYGAGRYPGEPCFVPRPGSSSEEDGYVVSYVYDEASNKSDLVILDASRFADDPVAVIHLPVRVPNGLHGSWMAV